MKKYISISDVLALSIPERIQFVEDVRDNNFVKFIFVSIVIFINYFH